MRTTVTLDDQLFRQAKAHAALAGRSLGSVIEEALRSHLSREPQAQQVLPAIPIYDCGVPLPGIDIDDTSALLDPSPDVAGRGVDALR